MPSFTGVGSLNESFDAKLLGTSIILGKGGDDYIRGGDTVYNMKGEVVSSGADWIAGGQGSDIILGGHGNDLIYGDDWMDPNGPGAADHILGGIGDDTIYGGAGADFINGEQDDDTIDGGDGADVIWGGDGADTIKGGGGADVLYAMTPDGGSFDFLSIVTSYNGITGIPTPPTQHKGTAGYLGADFKHDVLNGGAGRDELHSGYGADTLTGGGGKDKFFFENQPGSNSDTITDFSSADDTIVLENHWFTGIGAPGEIASGKFFIGAAAHDSNDRIIYNKAKGTLAIDFDGKGGGDAIVFAHVDPGTAMSYHDILVI